MDYDDNDFQSQNLHLTGEGSSKFSPVLHPYALSRFDFDDSLQGNLRFDTLVENEVFLGIPSQEDNQWIDEFSRGSSGIEFNSSAVESCSISRRNNVWYEATSSESVEMLLKSVGQEDMVRSQTIIEESDAGNDLDSLPQQPDAAIRQDDAMENVSNLHSTIPPDEYQGSFIGGTAGGEGTHPKLTFQGHDSKHSASTITSELGQKVVIESCDYFASTGNNKKCDGVNQQNGADAVDPSPNINGQDACSISGTPLDNNSSSQDCIDGFTLPTQNVVDGSEKLNDLEIKQVASGSYLEHARGNSEGTFRPADECGILIAEAKPCEHATENCTSNVEAGITKSEKSLILLHAGDAALGSENYTEDTIFPSTAHASQYEAEFCPESLEIKKQQRHDVLHCGPPVAAQCNFSVEESVTESNSTQKVANNSELKMDAHVQILPAKGNDTQDKIETPGSVIPVGIESLAGNAISSSSHSEDGELSELDKKTNVSLNHNVVNLVGIDSSAELCREQQEIDNSYHSEDAPSISSDMPVRLVLMCEEKISLEQGNLCGCDQDSSSPKNGNPELLTDSVEMEIENVGSLDNDKRAESSLLPEITAEDAEIVHGPKSVSNVAAVEETALACPESSVGIAAASGAAFNTDEYSTPRGDGNSLLHTKPPFHVDKKDSDIEDKGGMSMLIQKESLRVPIESHSASEVENCFSDCTERPGETMDQPREIIDCDAQGDAQRVAVDETGEKCSESIDAVPVQCVLSIKQVDSTDVVIKNHNEDAVSLKAASLKAAGPSAESDKDDSDAVAAISCTQPSHTDKSLQNENKKAIGENVLVPQADVELRTDSTENNAPKEERSFTFDVSPLTGLTEGESGKSWQSFPVIQSQKISTGPVLASSSCKMVSKEVKEGLSKTLQLVEGSATEGGIRITNDRRTRRGSAKLSKENAKKGNHAKDVTPVKVSEKGEKYFVSGSSSILKEFKSCGNVDSSGTKPTCVISVPMSNLPDLNTLVPSSALYPQAFTDLQQVQLRAQIFVYGSLIQGAVPDEACMASAFGPSDSGKNVWEPAWHACVERLCGQRSVANIPETPVQSHSGSKASDQAMRQFSVQSKGPSLTVGRGSSKGSSSPVISPIMPLSSPLWNISTPCDGLQSSGMSRGPFVDYQVLSPLHPYQTPPVQNFLGHSTAGFSQSTIPGPWFTPLQTSSFDVNARFSPLPTIETVKLTPLKKSSLHVSSSAKHANPITVAQSGGSGVFTKTSLVDANKVTVTRGHQSPDPKSRKRKKVSIPEDLGQVSMPTQILTAQISPPVISNFLSKMVTIPEGSGQISLLTSSQSGLVSVPVFSSHFSTSVVTTTIASPACVPKGNPANFATAMSSTPSSDPPKVQISDKRNLISEETLSKVEEAKLQAEAAAAHAASAVVHCQAVWSQLDKEKDSGLTSDIEAKLASAAVAIAAAASIAKAAAATANVASNVAVQARLMADDALSTHGTGSFAMSNSTSIRDVVNNLGKATPSSILKGGEGSSSCSSSIIVAAREAAKKKVEAASAATRHAENLDAIVKAAELAAEAVSQVGKIVAMGDPLHLNEILQGGPDGYWKGPQGPSDVGVKSTDLNRDQANGKNLEETTGVSGGSKEILSDKVMTADCGILGEGARDLLQDNVKVVDDLPSSAHPTKTIDVVPGSEIGSRSNSLISRDGDEHVTETLKESSLKEGCIVEVYKDNDDYRGAWFSANIMSLRDGKAFVTYTDLQSVEGPLKEWIPIEGKDNTAPRIRLAHPMTSTLFGARKRRRAATRNQTWSVGDRVDIWNKNRWSEGVVREKKDETTFHVYLPARDEISVVRSWHLRPTLVWKEGRWIEWSSSQDNSAFQGDTPNEKRQKLGSPIISGKGKDKMLKAMDVVGPGERVESRLLPLSTNEKVFNIGRNFREENKPETLRTMRTGLWKEGSRVVFGIPKPGKKRKFMEVSKHYIHDGASVNNGGNDSVRVPKKLVPQMSGSRGWKNNSKTDPKEKLDTGLKPKGMKAGKGQSTSGRTSPPRDSFLPSSVTAPKNTISTDNERSMTSNDENESDQQNLMGAGSFSKSGDAMECQISLSSLALSSDVPKKASTMIAKSERLNRGKFVSGGGKSSKGEVKNKLIPEIVEPRRSNRRIQPTSRLLEGLQSSMIISKIPSSHDKSHKSQTRGFSKGNNHG